MLAAVYELSTVKPHVPERRRYSSVEWPIYCQGYYQALVMALQVLQLVVRRGERAPMNDSKPSLTVLETTRRTPRSAAPQDGDAGGSFLLKALAVVFVIFVLEVLVLLAALIVRAVG